MTSLKKLIAVLAVSLPLAAAAQAPAIKFKFSGDLNHQAMVFTDQSGFYTGAESISAAGANRATLVPDKTIEESYANFKYRLTFEGATEDNAIRGVYGVEIGGIRFGDAGTKNVGTDAIGSNGGSYSGDGDNYETRFAYLDFGLPGSPKTRLTVGLQPFTVNHYVWKETATGIQFASPIGPAKLTLAWMRTRDLFNTSSTIREVFADGDNYLLRGDFVPAKDLKVGAFALYQHSNPELPGSASSAAAYQIKRMGANTTFDLYNVGVDGALTFGNVFVNFDAIYQGGEVEGGRDVMAYFAHADLGVNLGKLKLTYTGWYSSGDDDLADSDIENYMTTDVDMFDSIVLFEGGYIDENYFTEAPHFLTFGAIFNKVALDFKVLPTVTIGGAAMYIMTAEDVTLGNGATENVLGTEVDAYVSYKPYPQLEVALNAGYLIAGDVMDAFEAGPKAGNGKADQDIFRTTGRIRYVF
jgi:hypothetical protein